MFLEEIPFLFILEVLQALINYLLLKINKKHENVRKTWPMARYEDRIMPFGPGRDSVVVRRS